jgi:phage minor tail protein G
MFLKSEPFEFNGETVTLYELSALQRIEFVSYIAELHQRLPDDTDNPDTARIATEINVKVGARIVAMSLWQADIKGPSVDELQNEVLASWPLQAIAMAEFQVKELSSMLPATTDTGSEELSEEVPDPGKSAPAS